MRGESPSDVLETRMIQSDPPVSSYAAELVRGVQAHRAEIDSLLSEYSRGWALDRMPAVDRNILRLGAYELLWGADVPDAVAISEAVVLAQDLSTDASPAFVNGLLARLLKTKPTTPSPAQDPGNEASDDETSYDEASDDETSDDETSDDEASADETSDEETSDDEASDDGGWGDEASVAEASDDEASVDKASVDEASEDGTSDDGASVDGASDDEARKG